MSRRRSRGFWSKDLNLLDNRQVMGDTPILLSFIMWLVGFILCRAMQFIVTVWILRFLLLFEYHLAPFAGSRRWGSL